MFCFPLSLVFHDRGYNDHHREKINEVTRAQAFIKRTTDQYQGHNNQSRDTYFAETPKSI